MKIPSKKKADLYLDYAWIIFTVSFGIGILCSAYNIFPEKILSLLMFSMAAMLSFVVLLYALHFREGGLKGFLIKEKESPISFKLLLLLYISIFSYVLSRIIRDAVNILE
jgi:hypothetical protein